MSYDVVIKGGTVYDGTGSPGVVADVAIAGDTIAKIGNLDEADVAEAGTVIDATGNAVSPGFINMLSHSYMSILSDGRSLADLKQGVTTQFMGEGWSMGPVTDDNKSRLAEAFGGELPWQSLREYLLYAEKKGVTQNVCSLIGATTLRILGSGYEDRPMTPAELDRVKGLVEDEMADGAMGIGSALIYPPGCYAPTDELIEFAKVAGKYSGKYFSHLRSEGDEWEESIDELLRISREGQLAAEVWHLKAAGKHNWSKMDKVLDTLEAARSAGEPISADIYPYTAGGTGMAACVPPRYVGGGADKLRERLADPATRKEIHTAISTEINKGWENLYLASGGGSGVFMAGGRAADPANEAAVAEAKALTGRTLEDYANSIGRDPVDTMLDLIEKGIGVGCMYFIIDEDNIQKAVKRPWISVGSDSASQALPEGEKSPGHPRTYGTFARFLGHYCRDLGLASLSEGIHRMSGLPASTLQLDKRGQLQPGWFADVVVFDPDEFVDTATYENSHSYAVGMNHVFVNGTQVLRDGEHSGSFSGRALSGPGRR
ncbi:MAG TPA: amidohydrolase family protein [Acidimicrobiales bacterium]|nr:amidohydrolase family protein [Acidimicrobiales bacterium]